MQPTRQHLPSRMLLKEVGPSRRLRQQRYLEDSLTTLTTQQQQLRRLPGILKLPQRR
jgi:hypothetical protein